MIPPVSVDSTSLGYTADALARRVSDLGVAAGHLARATVTASIDPRFDAARVEIDAVWREVCRLHDDLTAVLVALVPSEASRIDCTSSVFGAFGGVFGALSVVASAVIDGRAWAPLRSVSSAVEGSAPWATASAAVVGVERVGEATATTAPDTMAARVNRIPRGPDRIRVDRFAGPDGDRFEVYLGGTDFTAAAEDPWWAGTNFDLLASGRSRSVAATEEALRLAGVTRDTPIVLTGHSQGGAIALALARSGHFTVDAVFTVGTPVGLVGDAPNVPTFHVEHVNDVVPALGGTVADTTGTTWFATPTHGEWGIEAHLWETYRDTAARVDATNDPTLTAVEQRIRRDGAGVVSTFRVTSSW